MQICRHPENSNQTTNVFTFHKIGLRLRAAFVKVIDHDSWHKLYSQTSLFCQLFKNVVV
jgi:hypothetical protein